MGYFDLAVLGRRHLTSQGRHGSMCADKYHCVNFDDNGPFGVLPTTCDRPTATATAIGAGTLLLPPCPDALLSPLPLLVLPCPCDR